MEHMLGAHDIVREYLRDKNFSYQGVFLARSDPAMNYRLISAVLPHKTARQLEVDEERCLAILDRYSRSYQSQVVALAGVINAMARYVPRLDAAHNEITSHIAGSLGQNANGDVAECVLRAASLRRSPG